MSDLNPAPDSEDDSPGLPRSLKIFLAVLCTIVLAAILLHVTGHGMGGHSDIPL